MKRVIRKLKKIWYTYTGNDDAFLELKIQQFKERDNNQWFYESKMLLSRMKFPCILPSFMLSW